MKKPGFPAIKLTAVKSSAISALGFKNGVARIEFASGHTYDCDCTQEEYDALASAESIGKHYHAHFKGREFRKHPVPRKAA